MLDLLLGNGRPPTKCSWWLLLCLKLWLDRIYIFGDSAIFRFSRISTDFGPSSQRIMRFGGNCTTYTMSVRRLWNAEFPRRMRVITPLRLGRGAEYCDQFVCLFVCLSVCASVCLSVCPWAYLWNRWTDLHEFFLQIACDRGSVVLRRRCDTLCTSGFMDDVTFGSNGPYGELAMRGRLNVEATSVEDWCQSFDG